jgi:hypothetical protein
MSGELTVRIADERDSQPFAEWIAKSKQIPADDVKASLKEANPTSVTLVVEQDGEVILFAPFYAIALLGFIGFNPNTGVEQRRQGLEHMKKAAQAFWGMYGITTITTLSREKYPIAHWAMNHGFTVEKRQLFTLRGAPDVQLSRSN